MKCKKLKNIKNLLTLGIATPGGGCLWIILATLLFWVLTLTLIIYQ